MLISKSPRFVNEMQTIKEKLSKISDESKKAEIENLVGQLVRHVSKLDTYHTDIVNVRKLPEDVEQIRHSILELRKKIFRRLPN